MSTYSLLFIIDPFERLTPAKDSSMALMQAAIQAGYSVYICEMQDISIENHRVKIKACSVYSSEILKKGETIEYEAKDFQAIFMRKDPPVDQAYLYCTFLLSLAEKQGVKIVNSPQALRQFNEKLLALEFPDYVPDYCLSSDKETFKNFSHAYEKIILKPIDGMGGAGVFITHSQDPNFNVIIETLTDNGQYMILAQPFIPDIAKGDKRILILNGDVFPYALARLPAKDSIRGNLAAGGSYEIRDLSAKDHQIAETVSHFIQKYNIDICGIDVIGDYLTEVNITSPTCLVELSQLSGIPIADQFIKNMKI